MVSAHSAINLEINNKTITRTSPYYWKLTYCIYFQVTYRSKRKLWTGNKL